ncbi:response regulator [Chryseobacterium fluminis]|uniref:response regulator transcription factor n=1 Tax=Chryseobacterium fluminis TaxID=2983606 RepID=UPI00224EF05D|nr:response regulator [Chryseobacterium sp. MMS21-Ot14]UZT97924.1 response regulator [Chryseobacterium sp. MMS21-Ot14]
MKKIQIVEDNEDIRDILEILLVSENYEVMSFGSVGEFASRDNAFKPDLYLFDVMLPDGSGIDLCQQIKQDINTGQLPVIMMSAHANLSNIKATYQPDDFISKPFDISNVVGKIESLLN